MKKHNLLRPCPICSSNTGELLHTQKFVIPEGYPLPVSYGVVCCTQCGFVFADTPAKQKDYDLYYQNFSKYEDSNIATGSGKTSYDKDYCEHIALEISIHIPERQSSIIDIGCANGGLLGALNQMSYDNLTGLDPSPVCVDYIKTNRSISKAIVGSIFSQGIIDDISLRRSFDCAILSNVLEHIYDVQKAVNNVSNLIKDQGYLYLEVPNAAHYINNWVVPFYYFDCEHINHFDVHSLSNLLTMNGFDIVAFSEKQARVSNSDIYPLVSIIGRKKSAVTTSGSVGFAPDLAAKNSVLEYIEKSKAVENSIRIKLESYAGTQSPVIVWGAGNFTMRLLAESLLGRCNITAYIDNDSKKWGKTIRQVSIFPPEKLKDLSGTIIICAALFSNEILLQIRAMGISSEPIVLK